MLYVIVICCALFFVVVFQPIFLFVNLPIYAPVVYHVLLCYHSCHR